MDDYIFCPKCAARLVNAIEDGQNVKRCLSCGFIFWGDPKPVVSILIAKDQKVLMLERARKKLKGYWVLPGGYVRHEESAQEAIVRETNEETRLDVKIDAILGAHRIDNDPPYAYIDIIFIGSVKGNITLSEENSAYEFFDIKNLPKLIAYKHREAIFDWNKQM